ncbi:MAG TPA: hypothetical protein VGH82_16945 [Gaiellaceae bacterium]|jgi:hypothetical protein
MAPKTPKQLIEQVLRRNKDRPTDDHSVTAEGLKVPNPTPDDFFGNLAKAFEPDAEGRD